MIDKLLHHHAVRSLKAGEVAEFHLCDGEIEPGYIHIQSLENFCDDWAELLGTYDTPFSDSRWIGIVHETGAVLFEIEPQGVRQ